MTHTTTILSKTYLGNNLYQFEIGRADNEFFSVQPGQYFKIHMKDSEGVFKRSYSVANPIERAQTSTLEFVIAIAERGRSAEYIKNWNVGDELFMSGPHGQFLLQEDDKNIVAIATGTGIAPFRSMMHLFDAIVKKGHHISIVHGSRALNETLYAEDFLRHSENTDNFSYHLCLSQEKNPFYIHGRVQEHLREMPLVEETTFYLCGNPNMVEEVNELLQNRGIPQRSIRTESYISPPA